MLPFEDRYSRQRRLDEVGPSGQARIERAHWVLQAHPGLREEKEYLRRAGAQRLELSAAAAPEFRLASYFHFSATADLARGAWTALARIRRCLELESAPPGPAHRRSGASPAERFPDDSNAPSHSNDSPGQATVTAQDRHSELERS